MRRQLDVGELGVAGEGVEVEPEKKSEMGVRAGIELTTSKKESIGIADFSIVAPLPKSRTKSKSLESQEEY